MLEFYHAENCPYSAEVRETLTELGDDEIQLLVDTDREEQVAESEAIVDYLETQYGREGDDRRQSRPSSASTSRQSSETATSTSASPFSAVATVGSPTFPVWVSPAMSAAVSAQPTLLSPSAS
jgi:hypothetical protein